MKQILQNMSNGETTLADVPCPAPVKGQVLIQSSVTLVSAGTERMLVEFGKGNLIAKARSQPDKVKMVMEKVKTDGIGPTLDAVRSKLDQPLPLGYCNVGRVLDSGGTGLEVGQRVVSNGHHAEVVRVPKNLCVKVPDGVDDESASFTVLGAIALQGIRLVQPTLGECVVVTGLGLIGLMAVQLLRANGCRVLGIDFDARKCNIARGFGAETVDLSKGEDPLSAAESFSRGRGVDGVLITASAKSNEPMSQAARMCRKRGRVVLVGVVGLELSRADFYEKEISFQVSCSYGPGRYDVEYEDKGKDYPIGFVRWTEQRNFEAILDMLESGLLEVKPLISHRYAFAEALQAYETLGDRSSLGITLKYESQGEPDATLTSRVVEVSRSQDKPSPDTPVCAFLGAGNYASRILIPAFARAGADLCTLVSSGGVSAAHNAKKNGFRKAASDEHEVFNDSSINAVAIVTRHDLHAQQVVEAIKSGKHVFVEKPLALSHAELNQIQVAYEQASRPINLMVGFNRRFSPLVVEMMRALGSVAKPKCFIMTMNAGSIPADHWTQDIEVGGGRIIGEACHYIDLMRFMAGSQITSFMASMVGETPEMAVREDKASITLHFENGSFGTIHYFANGGKSFPKERIEVFCNDAVLQLDNFRSIRGYGWPRFKDRKLFRQNKGQDECAQAFVEAIKNGNGAPIPFEEMMEVSRVSIDVANSLRKKNA